MFFIIWRPKFDSGLTVNLDFSTPPYHEWGVQFRRGGFHAIDKSTLDYEKVRREIVGGCDNLYQDDFHANYTYQY